MRQAIGCSAVCCTLITCLASNAAAQLASGANQQATPVLPRESATLAPHQSLGDQGFGLGWLIESTLNDFQRLPSTHTATFLTLGAAGAVLGGRVADPGVTRALTGSPTLDRIMAPGETLGGARLQFAGALATYGVGRLTKSPKVAAIGGDLIRAQILTQAVTAGIKLSVRRDRPDGTQFSFPSGHSAVTFTSATVLQRHLGWRVGVPAYAVASYVAASRIQERRHFLTDVAYGAALGILSGRTVTVGRGDARFALAPNAVPGGAGMSLNWVSAR